MPAKKKEAPAPSPAPASEIALVAMNTPVVLVQTPKERAAIVLRGAERELELVELVKKSADITEVLNADGREQIHRMAMDLKNARCDITNEAKDARDDANKFSAAIIAEEKRLIALVSSEETRVFKLRDDFDAKLAAEKAEKERIEAERIAAIRAKIATILATPSRCAAFSSALLTAQLIVLADFIPSAEEFGELAPEAHAAVNTVGVQLMTMRDAAAAREKEEAERLAAIAEEQRKVEEQAEANRIEGERLAAIAAENERKAAEERDAIAARDAALLAESNRIAAQRAQLEAEMAAFKLQQEAARQPVAPEAVQSAMEAENAQPEPVAQLVVAVADAEPLMEFRPEAEADPAHELREMIESMPIPGEVDVCVASLRHAVKRLMGFDVGPDFVRAVVESELLA